SKPIVVIFMADSSSSFKWLLLSSTLAHRDAAGKRRSPYHYPTALRGFIAQRLRWSAVLGF
ncbi:MAG: hypothetical protein WAV82_09380, partial [Methylobacter sp.]